MVMKVGVIGCGNISDNYFRNGPLFADIAYVACADLRIEAARAKAETYGIEALSIDALLARDDIDAVLNLTVPAAHAEVSLQALDAGKHVFTEKPLAVTLAEGQQMVRAAQEKGLRLGSAPDTILGPGVQTARSIVEAGTIGEVITGLATFMSEGMESWHPNPEFFFKKGGGPVLDMGPYYVAALTNLLGPVIRVQATGRIGKKERLITAPGALHGQSFTVDTFTSVNALLSFASGAEIPFLTSWDVGHYDLRPIELHGSQGTLRIPDPNNFGGTVAVAPPGGEFTLTDTKTLPFGADNLLWDGLYPYSCYRGLGLADMARSLKAGVAHRCSAEFGLHTLEVLLAIETAATEHRAVEIQSRFSAPRALSSTEAQDFLAPVAEVA